jgi:hypothetical protein
MIGIDFCFITMIFILNCKFIVWSFFSTLVHQPGTVVHTLSKLHV